MSSPTRLHVAQRYSELAISTVLMLKRVFRLTLRPTRGEIAHLVIDATGLKVFGEGEWKVKKHSQKKRRVRRKLHLAVDAGTHEVIYADLSLNNVTDAEAHGEQCLLEMEHGL